MTEDEVRQHLAYAGPITELQVPMNADQNRIAGYAFVRYTTGDGTQSCLQWDRTMYAGREFRVERAKNQAPPLAIMDRPAC
ncbi:unnamed protein product [Prorocentrum cordatum]|uniref:RRM domain-containing protein n=1 Tax=Prorocentrum cordatum TaxID=2364126 RepID=A0ABN9PSP3_9DINO|nr:unnamed protein product [Polarella glacialis]